VHEIPAANASTQAMKDYWCYGVHYVAYSFQMDPDNTSNIFVKLNKPIVSLLQKWHISRKILTS
jgi:hypothetical protein